MIDRYIVQDTCDHILLELGACKLPSGLHVKISQKVAERKKRWPICRWHFTTVAITIKDFSDGGKELKVEDGK